MRSLLEKLRQFFPPLPAGADADELRRFEDGLDRRLPGPLRSLYQDHNGQPRGVLEYHLLPLHDAYQVADGVWCFWEWELYTSGEGADYHFADGSIHCPYQTYPSVQDFLQSLVEAKELQLQNQPPPLPDDFRRAESLDEPERSQALLEALAQAEPECSAGILAYLKDEDEAVVIATCQWLARHQILAAIRPLAYAVTAARQHIQAAARQALQSLGGQLVEYTVQEQLAPEFHKVLAPYRPEPGDTFTLLRNQSDADWEWTTFSKSNTVTRDFPASVRTRPGLYFGRTDGFGTQQVLLELVANGVDQFLQANATRIRVRHDQWTLTVEDDGAGYPLDSDLGHRYLTQFHNSPTGDDHAPHVHLVTRGVGLAPVNAVCSNYQVESVRHGQGYCMTFQRGQLITQEKVTLDFPRGTRIHLTLDPEIWQAGFQPGNIRRHLFDFVHLVPGLLIELNQERFHAPRGLLDLATFHTDWPGERSFSHNAQTDFLTLHLAAVGQTDRRMHIESWVNGARTEEHGSHVDGALEALQEAGWRPARLLLHVILREPQYAGPVRRRLTVPRALREVRKLLRSEADRMIYKKGNHP